MVKYITGFHALNKRCSLNTSGDWHRGNLDWNKPEIRNSEDSVFGEWGLEDNKGELYANHIRAVLDLFEDGQKLPLLFSFHNDFISSDEYNDLIREKVLLLDGLPHYNEVAELVKRNLHRASR